MDCKFIFWLLTLYWHSMPLGVGRGQNVGLTDFCHILTLLPPGASVSLKHMSSLELHLILVSPPSFTSGTNTINTIRELFNSISALSNYTYIESSIIELKSSLIELKSSLIELKSSLIELKSFLIQLESSLFQ